MYYKFNFKNFKITKTKSYIKEENVYFFFNSINKNSKNWIIIEQNLKAIDFNCWKVFNQTSRKILKHSIYKNTRWIINNVTFLIKPKIKKLSKQVLMTNFEFILFNLLALKINNRIYPRFQLKKSYSLDYRNNIKLIFQFNIVNLRKLK